MSDTAPPRDPILDDPPGTIDQREPAEGLAAVAPVKPGQDRREPEICPLCGGTRFGRLEPVTDRSPVDQSRRFECTECDYAVRRNWAYWVDAQ